MKKYLLILILGMPIGIMAQVRNDGPPPEAEGDVRFPAIREAVEAFITERLELTEEEAQVFFPLYWAQESQRRSVRRSFLQQYRRRTGKSSLEDLTEAEAREFLKVKAARRRIHLEQEEAAEAAYLEVIPAVKLVRLEEAEAAFRRKLLDRVRGRKGGK